MTYIPYTYLFVRKLCAVPLSLLPASVLSQSDPILSHVNYYQAAVLNRARFVCGANKVHFRAIKRYRLFTRYIHSLDNM